MGESLPPSVPARRVLGAPWRSLNLFSPGRLIDMCAIGDYLLYGVPYGRSSTCMPVPANTAPSSVRTAVTVLLTNDETAFMDELAAEIRRRTGGCISRSAMLRA